MQEETATRDTRRKWGAIVFFVGYLVLQLVIPLCQWNSPFPARFAWQMFSRASAIRTFTLIGPGIKRSVNAGKLIGNERGDIDLEKTYPQYACRTFSNLEYVRWKSADGTSKEWRCR